MCRVKQQLEYYLHIKLLYLRLKLYTSISSLLPLEDCTVMVGSSAVWNASMVGFLSLQPEEDSTHGWYVDKIRICRHLMSLWVGTSVVDHEFFCRLVSRCHWHQHLQSCSVYVSCRAWRVGVCASFLVAVPNSGLLTCDHRSVVFSGLKLISYTIYLKYIVENGVEYHNTNHKYTYCTLHTRESKTAH